MALSASLAFCAVLTWFGWRYALRGASSVTATLGLSRAWFYAPIPLGAALSIVALLGRPAAPSSGQDVA